VCSSDLLGVELEESFTWQTHINRIADKGSKCVGLMRRASRDLPRECLEKLYLTMIRPIIEYGGLLFEGCPDAHTQALDKVQRAAALVCTGGYKHTSTSKLMDEMGWDQLKTRREIQRTCLMYKIQKQLAPQYLISACPPLVGEGMIYNLRNADNIAIPMGRRTGYINSFMPSSVRLWNALDRDIRTRNSLDSFKYHLKKVKFKNKNKLYPRFNGNMAVNHTRIRMGLSGLKSQRHDYNHVPRPTCDFCGAKKEDPMHYFMQCRAFATMRVKLMVDILELYRTNNIVLDLTRTLKKKELIKNLLCGDSRLEMGENVKLFQIVQHYIHTSQRF
jgi:hypothetical protein